MPYLICRYLAREVQEKQEILLLQLLSVFVGETKAIVVAVVFVCIVLSYQKSRAGD